MEINQSDDKLYELIKKAVREVSKSTNLASTHVKFSSSLDLFKMLIY
jgi:hypothetical protein